MDVVTYNFRLAKGYIYAITTASYNAIGLNQGVSPVTENTMSPICFNNVASDDR